MTGARLLTAWLAGAALLLSHGGAIAADRESAEPAAGREPSYHRVYVPAKQIQKGAWTKGYLPIDAEEFGKLVEAVHAGAIGAPGAGMAEIEQAEYSAQLVGEDLLVGEATLRLARWAEAAGMLPLEPCSVALGTADWQDQKSKAATVGVGPEGGVKVTVEGEVLRFDWSLRAERTASGAIVFRIELPAAPISRLLLDAPAGLEVIANRGIASKAPAAAPSTTRWTFELGGQSRLTLRTAAEGAARERRPLTLLRQSLTYDLSSRGVNLAAQLILDIHGEPLQRIAVDLDPGLRLIGARYGELQVPFSVTEDVESRMSHVVLQMPEPIDGTGRVLQLSAMAPLVVGKHWQLPGLRPEAMSWQEGTATLLIPGALVLEQLKTDGCRQSRTVALPAPASGESLEIQYFRPGATLEVFLTQPRDQVKVASGALVELGQNEVVSRTAVELNLARGERRAIQFEIKPAWTVDTVEDLAANQPLEWDVDEQASKSRLRIRLENAISPERPARLMIRGHRAPPATAAFEGRQLEMLGFDGAQGGERLISIRGAEGIELRFAATADLNRLDPFKLTPIESRLFPQAPTGFLFAADTAFSRSTIALERLKASYAAEIRIDAAVQKDSLVETYTIQCTPETSRVDRLLVRLSQAREAPLEWNLAGGNSGQFSARKISAAEQAQVGLVEGGEAWELNLHLARPGAFELRGVRTSQLTDATPLALASVAQAAVQRGTLTIRALGSSGLAIKNRRLSAIPAELLESGRYQTTRATYQYQPGRDDLGAEPAVSVVAAAPVQSESGAWVWSNRLDSRYTAGGTAVHWATLCIQTSGQQRVRVKLPAEAQLQSAWIDDQRLELVLSDDKQPGFVVNLPPGRGFATLSLYYATAGELPALVSSSEPAFAELDIPAMSRQWTVWLPPDFEIPESSGRFPIESMAPLSLARRLFGGLGRDATSSAFNPLARRDWRQLVSRGSDAQAAREAGRQFAENLGTLMSEYLAGEAESELTWGQLLSLCADEQAQSHRTLLVDSDSLAKLRLGPQSRVRYQPGDSAFDRGVALLRQANLVSIASSDVIGITSATTVAVAGPQIGASDSNVLMTLSPGALSDEFEQAVQGGNVPGLRYVAQWRQAPQRGQSPWVQVEPVSLNIQPARAWNSYRFHLSQGEQPRIRIVHTAAIMSLAWAVFLAVMALGLVIRRQRVLIVLGSLAAAAALLLPAAYAPLASAVFVGSLACLVLRITNIPRPSAKRVSEKAPSARGQLTVAHHGAILLLTAAILNFGAGLLAWQPQPVRTQTPPTTPNSADPPTSSAAVSSDMPKKAAADVPSPKSVEAGPSSATQPGTSRPAVATTIHRVFVPVDDEQHLVGGKYFISEEFFNQLYRQAAAANGRPKDWLITRAVYQGTLARDPASKQLNVSQLKAVYDLQVLRANGQILLPFPREGMASPLVAARIDGRPIKVSWKSTGDELMLPPLPAGACRLELDLQSPLQTSGTSAGFDLAIPALAGATLELTVPSDAPAIEVPAARGQVRLQKDRGTLKAQLGACNRLSVRWPLGIGMEASAANLEVEELIWVKVRPGTTMFDAKFKYRVVEGGVRQIRILTDPRLRLLPSTSPQAPIAHTIPGDPQRIDLEFPRMITDQVVVELSFLLTGTSGVGNLQFPRLESNAARATRRWLAASVDPALESKEFPGEDSKPLAIADFMAAWGAADTRPQAVYSIPRGEAMWVLATQPSEPRTTVEQVSSVSLGRGGSLVELDAALTITGGYLFQLTLKGPPNLAIEKVTLVEDNVQRVVRWSTDETGLITVFLSGPITGRQRLNLRGRVEPAGPDSAILPQLELTGAETKRNHWRLYRQSDVLVEVDKGAGTEVVKSDDLESSSDLGALVGCYDVVGPRAGLSVKLSPNVPQTKAVMVTTLERDGDRWMAQIACHVKVLEGVVDALAFDIPPQWVEPFRVEPPARVKIVPVPGEARRQLVLFPDQPLGDKWDVRINGRVALSAGERLRVPDIVPQRIQQVDRFVVLPQRLDLQQIVWETMGLARANLPSEVAPQVAGGESTTAYQVEGERFQALLKSVQRASTTARVKLADIQVVGQADGNCQGVATFDVEPAGATTCVLQLPANCQLLHASLESVPAQLVPLGEDRWRLSLGPPELPQRLEVIYVGRSSGSSGRRHFDAPRLNDLEVDQTLWTIYDRQRAADPADANLPQASAVECQLLRLKSIAELAQLPAEIVGEHLLEEIARWYRPWRNRYSGTRDALTAAMTLAGRTAAQSGEAIEAVRLDALIGEIDARLASPPLSARADTLSNAPSDLLLAVNPAMTPSRFIVQGPSSDIEVRYPQIASAGWAGRISLSIGFLSIAMAAVILLRDREFPKLKPWIVITVVGVAWWLLLAPSVVGLLILIAGAGAALRQLFWTDRRLAGN